MEDDGILKYIPDGSIDFSKKIKIEDFEKFEYKENYLSEKDHWLMVLQQRKEHFLYVKEPRDFDAAKMIREMMKLVAEGKVKDYSILEDFGIDVEMPVSKGKIICS